MKIIKVFDKKVGKKEYHKYRVPLPKKIAEESGLLEKEIKAINKDGKIIIEEDKGESNRSIRKIQSNNLDG